MENNKEIIHESEVKELIIELRGEKVLIDRDVAKLYGVETRDINKAVKNNAEKYNTNIHLGILFCLHTYKCLNIFKININNDAEDVLENTNI